MFVKYKRKCYIIKIQKDFASKEGLNCPGHVLAATLAASHQLKLVQRSQRNEHELLLPGLPKVHRSQLGKGRALPGNQTTYQRIERGSDGIWCRARLLGSTHSREGRGAKPARCWALLSEQPTKGEHSAVLVWSGPEHRGPTNVKTNREEEEEKRTQRQKEGQRLK